MLDPARKERLEWKEPRPNLPLQVFGGTEERTVRF